MKKACLTMLALVLCLGMVTTIPNVWANSYDPTNLEPPNKDGLMLWNQGGQGDALYANFYRATVGTTFGDLDNASDFMTYVSITNTSDKWVAAHVRLRSGRYSIEVYDFPVLLSPHDVFWFQFEPVVGSDGSLAGVSIWSEDDQTLKHSGLIPADSPDTGYRWYGDTSGALLKEFKKLAYDDAQTVSEMSIGDIEVFGLFSFAAPESANPVFQTVMGDFFNNGSATVGGVKYYPEDCPNVLSGAVFMGSFANGLYTGYSMDALANFRTSNRWVLHRDQTIRKKWKWGSPGMDLLEINGYDRYVDTGAIIYNPDALNGDVWDEAYTDPDWATYFGPTWNDGDYWVWYHRHTRGDFVGWKPPAGYQNFSIDAVDDALAKMNVSSTYFNGGFTGETYTMEIVSFPTKYLHVFFDKNSGLPKSPWPVGDDQLATQVRRDMDVASGIGSVGIYGSIWDTEQNSRSVYSSPQFYADIPNQVNCLPIGNASLGVLQDFCFLTHDGNTPFSVASDDFKFGWFRMSGFGLAVQGAEDPRTSYDPYYSRKLPLLNCIKWETRDGQNLYARLIPAVVHTYDWEFMGSTHARSYEPSFDNPHQCRISDRHFNDGISAPAVAAEVQADTGVDISTTDTGE